MKENITCSVCQGVAEYIGTLGSSSFIFRCRHCGIETFKREERVEGNPPDSYKGVAHYSHPNRTSY